MYYDVIKLLTEFGKGANWPRCELTNQKVRVDHKPIWSSRAYMTISTTFQNRKFRMVGRCNFYLFIYLFFW